MTKLSDTLDLRPINEFPWTQCPCGLSDDCLDNLKNVRRVMQKMEKSSYVCGTGTTKEPGALCVCSEICTCPIVDECFLTSTGAICAPECTCGWTECHVKGIKYKIIFGQCTCSDNCSCCYTNTSDCFRIPFILKIPSRPDIVGGGCYCDSVECACDDLEECYMKQVKEKYWCVCGSGLCFTDCSCYNKEYCYEGKWPPCCDNSGGKDCTCPDRETCFKKLRLFKCKNCDHFCHCGYKDFCDRIAEKKNICKFAQDTCMYTDKLVRLPVSFHDEIGRRVKPTKLIEPLQYEKCNPDGSFKTPYHTSVMIKLLNSAKEIMYKHPFQITANVNELRRDLSIIFKLPLRAITLRSHGEELHQTLLVAELGYKPYDVVELYLDIKDVITPIPDYFAMVIPDIITVRIKLEEYLHKDIPVEIYDRRIKKPFIGGYLNKKTGIEYHHAYTQTGLRMSKISHELQNSRDTQTYWLRNRQVNTTYSRGTQMNNENIYIPSVADKIMSCSVYYENSQHWEARLNIEAKIRTIQRYFRAWKMRKALHHFHEEYWQCVRNEEMNELDRLAADQKRRHDEIIRKTYPRSRADYSMLYGMLAKWKKAETDRICQTYTKAARVAELYILLDKEVKILNIIEKHRKDVRDDMRMQQEKDFFEEISAPIKWHGYKHLLIEMHTEKTQRAQKYKELYYALCRRDLTQDQRLTLLLSLKYALRDHVCHMADEIVTLIDQECELLVRGFGNKELDMLRKRQQLLVLEHVKSVQCNDCVTKRYRGLREIHMDTDQLIYCKRCEKMKFSYEFPIEHTRTQQQNGELKVCTICTFVDTTTKPYIDIAPYRFMLDWIIEYERKKNTESCVMYMINERDIQYIVNVIWHGQSLLTESRDLYALKLLRWRLNEPWSPWNCVLLQNEAAYAHLDVEDPVQVYGANICNNVNNKHLIARKKFHHMFYVNEFFMKTGEMKGYRETIVYTPVPSVIFCNELCTEPDRGAPCVSEKCLTSNDPKNNVRERIID